MGDTISQTSEPDAQVVGALLAEVVAEQERHISLPTGEMTLNVKAKSKREQSAFAVDDLIGFAARANPKRGFLFLSKVLGKHWPASPSTMRAIHQDLAARIPADLPQPLVFIAMAETAIGLGQGVFEAYKEANPSVKALFLHSSRYHVAKAPLIEFAEAHSHAPQQFLHCPMDPEYQTLFTTARSLVLVDDEASTGNTFVNLISACRGVNRCLERVHLSVITNFMGEMDEVELSSRFGLTTTLGATLSGSYAFVANGYVHAPMHSQQFAAFNERGASENFGRLGLNRKLSPPTKLASHLVSNITPQARVLILGTGEFMHMAFLLGTELENLGCDVFIQATTRSPILQWGDVKSVLTFPDNYGEGIANYLYNVTAGQYDQVFICHETPANDALRQIAQALDARLLHFLSETHIEEIPIRGLG